MWDTAEESEVPLTGVERAVLAEIATIARFKRGEIIFKEGDPASALFSIIDGVVKLYRMQVGAEEHVVRFMFANDLIGLAEFGKYVNSAKSVTSTTLYKMPTRALEPRLRQNPGLEFHILNKLSHELRRTQDHALLLAKHRASAKLGMFIRMLEADQNLAAVDGAELSVPMPRTDIAAYLGMSPEAVTRAFADLVSCGALSSRDRRHLKIVDRAKLDAIIAETEDPTSASTALPHRRR